jgi:uncharacterized protein (DUF1697 family)
MTYIALLRGINVGGNKMVAMADLRATLERLGFTNVRTLLQSGNVVFEGKSVKATVLEKRLEEEIARRLGVQCDLHVRTADEWSAVVNGNPFAAEARTDPGHLLVTFYREPLDPTRVAAFQKSIAGPERLRADGRHLYMTFPEGIGRSKATVNMDKMLGAKGTARNWNTVMKLAALARG